MSISVSHSSISHMSSFNLDVTAFYPTWGVLFFSLYIFSLCIELVLVSSTKKKTLFRKIFNSALMDNAAFVTFFILFHFIFILSGIAYHPAWQTGKLASWKLTMHYEIVISFRDITPFAFIMLCFVLLKSNA